VNNFAPLPGPSAGVNGLAIQGGNVIASYYHVTDFDGSLPIGYNRNIKSWNNGNYWIYAQDGPNRSFDCDGAACYGVGHPGTIYKSSDGGFSWLLIDSVPGSNHIWELKINEEYIVVCTFGSVHYRSRFQPGFTEITDQNGNSVPGQTLYLSGDTLLVGTANHGIYYSLLSALPLASQEQSSPDPRWQIFPNPASDEVNISVPGHTIVASRIYALNGKLVLPVHQPQSCENCRLNLSGIAAGYYLVEVELEGNLPPLRKKLLITRE